MATFYGALDHGKISNVLSRHLLGRLDAVERDLEEVRSFYGFPPGKTELAIRLTQCTDDEWRAQDPPDDFWTGKFPVDRYVLKAWRADAHSLASITDALEALRMFAMQEAAMAMFEGRASDLAIEVDRAIEREMDILRGK